MGYNRQAAIEYARKYALNYNPDYYDFGKYNLGGDCTNFISQCLHAGGAPMTHRPEEWYYYGLNSRSPSWSAVEFLYRYLTAPKDNGFTAVECQGLSSAVPGDVIQLSFDGQVFSHSLFISNITNTVFAPRIFVCTHTYDSCDRDFSTYQYRKMRLLHITN
ncbi:MAG: amidase domain-containing protein [Christensenellaceae bacterium]|jgi:hypothetical protein|nr:amidase domain-containing protein [Christensenellaceae bacterium]